MLEREDDFGLSGCVTIRSYITIITIYATRRYHVTIIVRSALDPLESSKKKGKKCGKPIKFTANLAIFNFFFFFFFRG